HAVIELHVFTGVEVLIKQADAGKDFAAIGHGHALGRHILFDVPVDPRIGMMSQARRPSQGNRALENGRAGNIERLRSAHTISATALKGVRQMNQIRGIVYIAVTIDDDMNISLGGADRYVAGGAGPTLGIWQ